MSRPSNDELAARQHAMLQRLVSAPVNITRTSEIEDRTLARMERDGYCEIGSTHAKITDKGRQEARTGTDLSQHPQKSIVDALASPAAQTDAFAWADPPERRSSRTSWVQPYLQRLKERPGKRARLITMETKARATARSNGAWKYSKTKKLGIETCARGCDVYARFVGAKP